MSVSLPETETQAEFARRIGMKPGYVTELKRKGRLVMTEDGRQVRVAESLALIADTRDPAKQGVRDRHAAARDAEVPADTADEFPVDYAADPLALRRARAQAEREEALLRKALREEAVDMGELLRREDVVAFTAQAVVEFRTQLQLLPATLALNSADSLKLREAIETALEKLSRTFSNIGKGEGQ